MKKMERAFVGNWRITEMEAWGTDYFDMEAPAHITVRKDLTGEFQFGLVQGELDGRVKTTSGISHLEFSWSGFDVNDPVSGCGWLQINGDQAEGRKTGWPTLQTHHDCQQSCESRPNTVCGAAGSVPMSRRGGWNTPQNIGGALESHQIGKRCSFSGFAKVCTVCEFGQISTVC